MAKIPNFKTMREFREWVAQNPGKLSVEETAGVVHKIVNGEKPVEKPAEKPVEEQTPKVKKAPPLPDPIPEKKE